MKRSFLLWPAIAIAFVGIVWAQIVGNGPSVQITSIAAGGGGGGSGNVTANGTMTAGKVIIGNDGTDVKASVVGIDSGGNVSTAGGYSSGVGGSVGGTLGVGQGTLPPLGTTMVQVVAPASVTSYNIIVPGAVGSTGYVKWTVGSGNATLSSVAGIPASDITAGTLTANVTLGENFGIVYDAALSADGKFSPLAMRAGTAGAALAFGQLVYLAAADSRWELAKADSAATSGDVLVGMCVLAAAADGDPTTILLQGFIRADAAFPTLTIGAPAYISAATGGNIVVAAPSTTGQIVRRIGFAWTADELYFNPSMDSGVAP